MLRHTNIDLDTQLVEEAAALLGTRRISDTVNAALSEVIGRAHRRRLAQRDLFDDVQPAEFDVLRRPRAGHA
jgi:Arc/MetJ family transcription regulator